MKNEIINNASGRKKSNITLIIICSAFIIYYSVMSMISPARKLVEMDSEFGNSPTENNSDEEKIYNDSTYLKLMKDRAFLQSRIAMAGTDSIYLTINLTDSTANIEISGVVVHRAKMSCVRISNFFSKFQ